MNPVTDCITGDVLNRFVRRVVPDPDLLNPLDNEIRFSGKVWARVEIGFIPNTDERAIALMLIVRNPKHLHAARDIVMDAAAGFENSTRSTSKQVKIFYRAECNETLGDGEDDQTSEYWQRVYNALNKPEAFNPDYCPNSPDGRHRFPPGVMVREREFCDYCRQAEQA